MECHMQNRKVSLLDCTLRDGGFVNDWQFGNEAANEIVSGMAFAGMNYVEIGFLREETPMEGRMVFETMDAASATIKKANAKRAIMLELGAEYPLDKIPDRKENSIEMIRVMIWKRMLHEGVEYCKALVDKGYEVGVQAVRTDDYSDEDFKQFIDAYNEINPTAIYVVDSFGLMHKEQVLNYVELADKYLNDDILLGYHAHNNMQQAYINAVSVLERRWKHQLMLDASVLGMGRGAGNLNTELLLHYLNNHGADYDLMPIIEIANKYIQQYWGKVNWGYSMPYFLSAINGRNSRYVKYMLNKNVDLETMFKVFAQMRKDNTGIRFDTDMCDELIKRFSKNE